MEREVLVAKIGGSTLGAHDTTLADVVELQRRGLCPLVVHGGGAVISDWLSRHGLSTRFERGLRVTDAETLRVVVAVLAGLVNKELVASLQALGGRAVGLSGADGGLLRARRLDAKMGFVGEIMEVDGRPLVDLMDDGFIPVVAPIAVQWEGERPTGQLLNINADTAAGAIARALAARWLVFLTDVPGVQSEDGRVLSSISPEEARGLIEAGVVQGGMIPKVEACLEAAAGGARSTVVDGRREHALLAAVEGQQGGSVVG